MLEREREALPLFRSARDPLRVSSAAHTLGILLTGLRYALRIPSSLKGWCAWPKRCMLATGGRLRAQMRIPCASCWLGCGMVPSVSGPWAPAAALVSLISEACPGWRSRAGSPSLHQAREATQAPPPCIRQEKPCRLLCRLTPLRRCWNPPPPHLPFPRWSACFLSRLPLSACFLSRLPLSACLLSRLLWSDFPVVWQGRRVSSVCLRMSAASLCEVRYPAVTARRFEDTRVPRVCHAALRAAMPARRAVFDSRALGG